MSVPYYSDKRFPWAGGASISIVELVNPVEAQYPFVLTQPLTVVGHATTAHEIIEELSKLERDWDGYGGLPVTPESRISAQRLLTAAAPAMLTPEISPTSNGTIGLEWKSSAGGAYIEIGRTRYSGHIQPRDGGTVYIEGQSALLGQEELAFIKQLLYGTFGLQSPTNSTQISKSVL